MMQNLLSPLVHLRYCAFSWTYLISHSNSIVICRSHQQCSFEQGASQAISEDFKEDHACSTLFWEKLTAFFEKWLNVIFLLWNWPQQPCSHSSSNPSKLLALFFIHPSWSHAPLLFHSNEQQISSSFLFSTNIIRVYFFVHSSTSWLIWVFSLVSHSSAFSIYSVSI